ncbi:MAG: DUF4390 domain-containing protein [Magnetococcales bacterium]|nr:DUF4390 domain-containing protein [Magnetococcales bacterium]
MESSHAVGSPASSAQPTLAVWYRFMGASWLVAPLLLLFVAACSPHPHDQLPTDVFQTAGLSEQEGKLYAQVRLTDARLKDIFSVAQRGEPILVTYRFRLRQVRHWLPDPSAAELLVSRRLRLRLITERYEMRDLQTDDVRTTTDPDEARQFLGDLGFMPLMDAAALIAGEAYRLEIHFHSERDGVSRMYRILNRWLTFWKPDDYIHHVPYRRP